MTGPKRILLSNEALMLAEGIARGGRPSASTVQFFEESGLAKDGYLDPDLSHVLVVLGSAGLAVTATRLIPGESHYGTLSLAAPAGIDDFVAKGGSDEIRDLLWLGPAPDAAVHLADFLGLAAPGAPVEPQSFDVSRDGWFALCALADHRMLAGLRARLDGHSAAVAPPTPDSLASLAAESLQRADSFRATYAADRLSPATSTPQDIRAGVASLARAGLAQSTGGAIQLSTTGAALVESLLQALVWGQLTTTIAGDAGPPGCLTTVRGVTNALLIGWNAEGTACSVNIHETASATHAVYAILLDAVERSAVPAPAVAPAGPEPVPPPLPEPAATVRFCASCGSQLSSAAKFCASCGARVPG